MAILFTHSSLLHKPWVYSKVYSKQKQSTRWTLSATAHRSIHLPTASALKILLLLQRHKEALKQKRAPSLYLELGVYSLGVFQRLWPRIYTYTYIYIYILIYIYIVCVCLHQLLIYIYIVCVCLHQLVYSRALSEQICHILCWRPREDLSVDR